MVNQKSLDCVQTLIRAFDDDQGVSENIFIATKELVLIHFGKKSEEIFSNGVDAIDGKYYSHIGHDLWSDVVAAKEK